MNLFPRKPGPTKDLRKIARAAAHRVLDLAISGNQMPQVRIDWALRVTGDLERNQPAPARSGGEV